MNEWWIIGLVSAVLFFAIGEYWAFRHPERQNTLSKAIYDLGAKWPLSIYVMGFASGALATHFFWHWCPEGSLSIGFLSLGLGQ